MGYTTGNDSAAHFILLGHSKEHADRAVERYGIKKMVVFTSPDLYPENRQYIEGLRDRGVDVLEVVELDPFKADSLETMTSKILDRHERYNGDYTIVVGLTGGTNLMAIAMATAAMIKGARCHYVLNNGRNDVLELSFFQELNRLRDLYSMERRLKGEC